MTVSTTTPSIRYNYTGPGDYTFSFKVYTATDLKLTYTDTSGVPTVLIYGTNYSVTLVTGVEGGTCSVTVADTDGFLDIERDTEVVQDVDWKDSGPLSESLIEGSFDRDIMILQEFEERLNNYATGGEWRGAWLTATAYSKNDFITGPDLSLYISLTSHTSGVWATDLAAGDWEILIDASTTAGAAAASAAAALVSENNAAASEAAAAASADLALASANATLWLVGTTYAEGDIVIDDLNHLFYISTTAANLGTQPSTDTTGDWQPTGNYIGANTTVTVGAAGDFATINAAITFLSYLRPIYSSSGITGTINLLAGFVMAEQIHIYGLNLGWIKITGVDSSTTITRSSLTLFAGGGTPVFFVGVGGVMPIIDQLFTMDSTGAAGTTVGITVSEGSTAVINSGCGVVNAGYGGLFVADGSTVTANSSDFSGAGTVGILCDNSLLRAPACDVSSAPLGLDARSSVVDISTATVLTGGIKSSFSSNVNARSTDCTGGAITVDRGGIINASSATGTLSQTANTLTADGIIFQ